jgi:hypothetical protein
LDVAAMGRQILHLHRRYVKNRGGGVQNLEDAFVMLEKIRQAYAAKQQGLPSFYRISEIFG